MQMTRSNIGVFSTIQGNLTLKSFELDSFRIYQKLYLYLSYLQVLG